MNEDNLISEYGSISPIGLSQGRMCDREGNDVLCGCGQLATCAILGANSYKPMCNYCHYGKDFKPPQIVFRNKAIELS